MSTHLTIDPRRKNGILDPKIYGHFTEHLGRCIYGGVWVGKDSTIPNFNGFRLDVLQTVKQIHPPLVRYPGGNFASGYHWQDGIGPRDQRPRRLDPAWKRDKGIRIQSFIARSHTSMRAECRFQELL